jgi:hypothetical protein
MTSTERRPTPDEHADHGDGRGPRSRRRAHQRRERQRVRAELASLRGPASDADDLDEPGVGYKPPRHHRTDDAAPARRRGKRHWKLPFWKRRSTARAERARRWGHPDDGTPADGSFDDGTPGGG